MTDDVIPGLDAFLKGLGQAESLYEPFGSRAMALSLQEVHAIISPYPPQPDRMRSGRMNTYVRGEGIYPKSAFVPDASKPGGFKTVGVKALRSQGRIKLTSQQMGKSYKARVTTRPGEIVGNLHNAATYSGLVIGSKIFDPKQVGYHAATGWPNSDDTIVQAMPEISKIWDESIDLFIATLKSF